MARTKQTGRKAQPLHPRKSLATKAARCRVYHTSNSVEKAGDLGSVFTQQSVYEWNSWRVPSDKEKLKKVLASMETRYKAAIEDYDDAGPVSAYPEDIHRMNTHVAVNRLMEYPSIKFPAAAAAAPAPAAASSNTCTASVSSTFSPPSSSSPMSNSNSSSRNSYKIASNDWSSTHMVVTKRKAAINAEKRLKSLARSDHAYDSEEELAYESVSSSSSSSYQSSSSSSSSFVHVSSSSSASSSSSSLTLTAKGKSKSIPKKPIAKRTSIKNGGHRRTTGSLVFDAAIDSEQSTASVKACAPEVGKWSDVSMDTRYDKAGFKVTSKEKQNISQVDDFISEFIHLSRAKGEVRHCSSQHPSPFPGTNAHKRFDLAANQCKQILKGSNVHTIARSKAYTTPVKYALSAVFNCDMHGPKHDHSSSSSSSGDALSNFQQEHIYTSALSNPTEHKPQYSQWAMNKEGTVVSRPRAVLPSTSRSTSSSSSISSSSDSSSSDSSTSFGPPTHMLTCNANSKSTATLEFIRVHTFSLPPLPYHLFRYPDYSIPISLAFQVVPRNEVDSNQEDPVRLVFLCLKPAPVNHPWGPWPLLISEAARKVRRNWARMMLEVKQKSNHLSGSAEELLLAETYANMSDNDYFNTDYDVVEVDGSITKADLNYEPTLLTIDIEEAIELGQIEVKPVIFNECPRAVRDFQTWAYDQYIDQLPPFDCAEQSCSRSVCSQVFCAEPGCPLSLCAFHASTLLWGSTPGTEIRFDGAIWIARCCGCHEQAVWDNVTSKANSDKYSSQSSYIPSLLSDYGPHRYMRSYKPRPTVILTITATNDIDVTATLDSSLYVTQWLGARNFSLMLMTWKMYANPKVDSKQFKRICSHLQTLTYSQVAIFFVQHRNAAGITSVGRHQHSQDLDNIDPLKAISQVALSRDPRIELHCVMVTCSLQPHTLSAYLTSLPAFQSFTGFSSTVPVEQGILYCANSLKHWLNAYDNTFLTQALLNNTTPSHVTDLQPIHCVRILSADVSPLFCLTPQGQPCDDLTTSQTTVSSHKHFANFFGVNCDYRNSSCRNGLQLKRAAPTAAAGLDIQNKKMKTSSSSNCNTTTTTTSLSTFPDCFAIASHNFILNTGTIAWVSKSSLRAMFDCKKLFRHILYLYGRWCEKGGIILILRYVVRTEKTAGHGGPHINHAYAHELETLKEEYYQALCMVDHFLAQSFFKKPDNVYLPDDLMTKEAVSQCRWGYQNERSWSKGNQLLQALGNYIHGSEFILKTIRGVRVQDDTPAANF